MAARAHPGREAAVDGRQHVAVVYPTRRGAAQPPRSTEGPQLGGWKRRRHQLVSGVDFNARQRALTDFAPPPTAATIGRSSSTATHHDSTLAGHRIAVERVILAMREQLSEELSLDEMAEIALMSSYHFLRVFRRLTGIPPSQFLSALRLEAAKRLLLTTEGSVTDICYEVGYNSLGTFTTRFTQLVGLPPGHLRMLSRGFTAASAEELLTLGLSRQEASGPAITGRIETEAAIHGLLFLGLFNKAIPRERPVSCAILDRADRYRIEIPGDGEFHVFGAGLARIEKPLDYLMCGGSIRGVAQTGPLTIRDGRVTGDTTLVFRPPSLLDPPLLVTLPLLIDERLAERFAEADAEEPELARSAADHG